MKISHNLKDLGLIAEGPSLVRWWKSWAVDIWSPCKMLKSAFTESYEHDNLLVNFSPESHYLSVSWWSLTPCASAYFSNEWHAGGDVLYIISCFLFLSSAFFCMWVGSSGPVLKTASCWCETYLLFCGFLQTCQTPIRPITPSSLLDSICWSISEPTSTASIYTDSFSSEDVSEQHTSVFFDAKGDIKDSEASFANLTRPLTERLLFFSTGMPSKIILNAYECLTAFSFCVLQWENRIDI